MNFVDQIRSYTPAWWRITLLGEPLMMIPVAIVVIVWLWFSCSRRMALWWGALLALGGAILIAQKLLYYVGGVSLASIRLYTVSGHSVAASYIYGSLIAIIARNWPRGLRYVGWAAVALMVLAIGVSRVAVAGHRIAEAVTGLALGILLLAWFLRFVWRSGAPRYPVWTLAAPCFAVMALTYGHVYEFETIFRRLGRWARPGAIFYR
jgi:undecaprenyl-diphosphatase